MRNASSRVPQWPARQISARLTLALFALSAPLYLILHRLERAMAPISTPEAPLLAYGGYLLALVLLFGIYGWTVRAATRGLFAPGAMRALLVITVAMHAGFAASKPYLSIDVASYVVQGHLAVDGGNPYTMPARAVDGTPLAAELRAGGWIPVHDRSPYGPLWTTIEAIAVRTTSTAAAAARWLRLWVLGFTLASGALIWLLARRGGPGTALAATLAFLANPAVITELSGDGHNDAAMIFFMLAALYLWVERRAAAGVVSLAMAALVKIVAGMIAPLLLVHAWRTSADRRRLVMAIGIGAAIGLVATVALFAPFWVGSATLDGLRLHGRPGFMAGSSQSLLYWYLTRSHSEQRSAQLIAVLFDGALLTTIGLLCWRVRDTRSLLRACGLVALAYLMLAPGYWPWYATLPIALLALLPTPAALSAVMAISLASRVAAPLDALRRDGLMSWERELFLITVVGLWLPSLWIAAGAVRRASQARNARQAATPLAIPGQNEPRRPSRIPV
jgi:hypothetical protein